MLDLEAAVHDDRKASGAGPVGRRFIDEAELEPQRLDTEFVREAEYLVSYARDGVLSPEYIHKVDVARHIA